ncbi:GntR family transcriptional regulator [Alkalihalobacillus trypoxylicola]|uniref:GntR family transcriptional regulator n=1 Tax=Alkalihalobacillus trypoxylicola TaxID=519424 RepID=A0A162DSK9_9BACI|nr:GntR family transcriptional regulator [Alkalihalobacillus trypoxylicola]KYG30720.1 GntR family transcriptional regulator [Alkalihalobacillus trypoxylicola]
MTESFQSNKPIYIQLADRIKKQIIRKELLPGEKLPSVREFGVKMGVNPNTVQRTYRELEGENIVESKRGQGTFISEDETILSAMREQQKHSEISLFVQNMFEMGYNEKEVLEGLNKFLNRLDGGTKN